jgi:hypothetical protein
MHATSFITLLLVATITSIAIAKPVDMSDMTQEASIQVRAYVTGIQAQSVLSFAHLNN